MRKFLPLIAALGVIALAVPAGASAADVTCTGSQSGLTVRGDLVVPSGSFCDLSDSRVLGNVRVESGANFATIVDTAVLGRVTATNVVAVLLFNTAVGRGLTVDTASDSVLACGSTVLGKTDVQRVGAGVTLGDSSLLDEQGKLLCPGNRFAGPVNVSNNVGALLLDQNLVVGSLTVNGNQQGIQLKANKVVGTLGCAGNAIQPEGGANVAIRKTGQCVGL